MRKILYSFFILFLSTLWLQGCGDDSSNPDGDTDQSDTVESDGDADGDDPDGDDPDGDDPDGDDPDGDSSDGDGSDGDTDDDGEEVPVPVPPVALCDMPEYTLLPSDQLGSLIDWEEDPFFNLTPGAVDGILSQAGYDALSPVPYGCRVFRFRYTTQDRGQAVEATAVLAIPANADLPDGPKPQAVFLHGTSGFSDPCAPSRHGDAQAQAALLGSLGFVTVLPDYIGMNGFGAASTTTHGYLIGEQVALGSWDALRAARTFLIDELEDGVEPSLDTIIWGGSQGGHAAVFAELYAPYYAPEFSVRGVVAAVPPIDTLALVEYGLASFSPPTVSLAAVLTTMRAWYGAPTNLESVFSNSEPYFFADNAEEIIFIDGEECKVGEDIEGDQISDLYASEFVDAVGAGDWDAIDPFDCYLKESKLRLSSVPVLRYTPTLVVLSELDDLVITAPQRDEFDELCAIGYQLDYLECADAGHSEGAVWSLPEQLAWAQARLNGEPMGNSVCQRSEPLCCSGSPADVCVPSK